MAHLAVIFHRSILLGSYCQTKSEVVREDSKKWLWEKNDPCGKILKISFREDSPHRRTMCKFREIWPSEIGKVVRYLPDKKKQKIGPCSRSSFCVDCTQNLTGPAPDNILGVPQISFKSVYSRRSYSWTSFKRATKCFQYSAKLQLHRRVTSLRTIYDALYKSTHHHHHHHQLCFKTISSIQIKLWFKISV